ncbi:MAG: hypothetical protein ACRD8Z_24695 [Nitrososphaeraceae archaeon]
MKYLIHSKVITGFSDESNNDFTIQAAIGSTVSQTNNIVNTLLL